MSGPNPKADWFFEKAERWRLETKKLRTLILDCGLTEVLKWGCPCYTHGDGNIVLVHTFKEYCAVLFFKGALLKDPKGVLVQQTKNVQAARQVRFTHVREVEKLKPVLKSLIKQAVEVERSGLKVTFKKPSEFTIPEEFQARLDGMPDLRTAFQGLTPGRQKGYLLHFLGAKQSKTREARVEKHIPRILDGLGIDD